MKKYIIDTDIYIQFLRNGQYNNIIIDIYTHKTPGIYFSSVVIHELLIGAIGKKGRDNVENLYRPFERVGRIVTPTLNIWKEAGILLSLLRQKRKDLRTKIPTIINDALIALSAKSIGATVFTINAQDFQIIGEISKFSLAVIEHD